ncbi:MAG: cobyrinate a,c-diamide synthase, partial [Proteobacteria bacterium]|nr:cobyrinate a,c-diamide synthase [Pseudomonadota bacterium]
SIIEGVMGLFDGKFTGSAGKGKFTGPTGKGKLTCGSLSSEVSPEVSPEGSTAHLAKVLAKPVLLVVDAGRAATSAGAVVKGFSDFDPDLRVKYVIFNRVGSDRHAAILEDSVRSIKGVTLLGCVRRDERLKMPSRHLGLVTNEEIERKEWRAFVRAATRAVEQGVDIDRLLRALRVKPSASLDRKLAHKKGRKAVKASAPVSALKGVRIAVARDKAFSFYYQENLDRLEEAGARLVNFSPLKSQSLPRSIGGIYLGGGYPELHSRELAANSALMDEIRSAAESGMPMLAECGGFIYLCASLKSIGQGGEGPKGGEVSALAGLFPFNIEMTKRRTALGYREVAATDAFPFLSVGERVRGHEYHYSRITGSKRGTERAFVLEPSDKNGSGGFDGYLYKQTVAGYTHLHFASNPAFAPGFVRSCRAFVETSNS